MPSATPSQRAARDPLVGQEVEAEQEGEERHGRLRDPGDARVDVLLAPADQPERDRGVDRAEHDGGAPGRAQVGGRAARAR